MAQTISSGIGGLWDVEGRMEEVVFTVYLLVGSLKHGRMGMEYLFLEVNAVDPR